MKKLSYIPMCVVLVLGLAGCSKVPTGSVGIWENSFTGYISKTPAHPGFHTTIIHDLHQVDTTQTMAVVKNMHPRDEHGVQMKAVTVVVQYSLVPMRVPLFYRDTKQLQREPHTDYDTIGLRMLEDSAIPYAAQIATETSTPQKIVGNLGAYAARIQQVLNNRLHLLYPKIDPYVIDSVTVPTFDLPTSIQKQVNEKAGYQAKLETIKEAEIVQAQEKKLASMRAGVYADALATASKNSGLTPEQIIGWEKARALYKLSSQNADGPVKRIVMQKAG